MRVLRSRKSTSDTSDIPEALALESNSNQNEDFNLEAMFGTGTLALSSDSEDLPEALPMFGLSELALGVVDDDDDEDIDDTGDALQPAKRKRVRHPPREPVICDVCNKQFTRKAHLVRHMYLHTGEKPFKCNHCPQSFNRKDHLRSHMKGHSDVKQFKCNQCVSSFSRMDLLRVHVLKNHGKYQKTLKPSTTGVASSGGTSTSGGGQQSSSSMPKLGFKVLTCRFCSMKFSQTQAYNNHIAEHKRKQMAGDMKTSGTDDDDDDCLEKNVERNLAEMHVESISNDEGDDDEEEEEEGQSSGDGDEEENEQSGQEEERQQGNEEETGDDEDGQELDDNGDAQEESSQQSEEEKQDEPPRKLECVVCGKENFSDQRALRRHYKVHKRRFICRFCGIKMSSAGSLMRHNMLHTGEKPFKCNKCDRKFSRKDALKAHLVAHEKDSVKHTLPRPYECTKCSASYTMRYNLIRHMRQCHQSQARNRNAVIRKNQGQVPLQQQQQQQTINNQGEEQQTPTLIQIDPSNPLKCMHCNKMFASMKSISTHIWYHNQEKRFTCKICSRAFKYATDLNRHVLTHKGTRKPISLTQQRANNRLALAKQQKQVSVTRQRASPNHNSIMVNGQRRYPCEFCTVIFNHRSNRSRHVRIYHSNQQQQQQGRSGGSQQQQQQQQRHQQLQRQQSQMKRSLGVAMGFQRRRSQPVSRNQLNLKANQAAALMQVQHMQIRQARLSLESNDAEEIQPNYNGMFKCDLCEKIFDKRYNYRLHLRTHNKQFSCVVCGLRTASQGDLTLHIRTHTGEKPFQCGFPNCEWKFARRSALTVHYRRHHGPNAKIKRQYKPQRVTPNMVQVNSLEAQQASVMESARHATASPPNNSILKTMLENYPCKSEPNDDNVEDIEQQEAQSPPTIIIQHEQQRQQKPKKNLPPPPPLIRYPLPPAMLQKKNDQQRNSLNGETSDESSALDVVILCKPCGQLISGKANYVDHMLEKHGTTVTAIGSTPVIRSVNRSSPSMNRQQLMPKKFAPPTLLRRPIQEQQQQKPVFSCQQCGEMFGSRHDMTVHNLTNHSIDRHVMCGLCRKLCSTIGFLSRHYQYCHPHEKNAAEEARIILANNARLQHETEYYDDDNNGQDEASAADQLLFPEVVIKEEMDEEDGGATGDNDGSEGDLSFTPVDLLETSYQSTKPTHGLVNYNSTPPVDPNLPYPCPLCSKGFKDKKALADHKWYHSREPIYPCTVTGCEKRFKLKNDLIRHMRRHLQERPHVCPQTGCESRFYQNSDLIRHLNKVHGQIESSSYACQHCSAGFSKPDLLVRHMRCNHPGQDVSHILVLQMLDQKKKAEEKQMQEFLANLPPEEEEEDQMELEPEWSQDHDLDYSFELQQLEIDAFDNEDDLEYRQSLSPTQRHKAFNRTLYSSQGQATMMEKLANENGALEEGPPFTCQTCNKVYDDRQKFIYHRYYHLREFRYTCPEEGCGEKFKIKGHVERHIRTYHNSEKPVKNILHCPVPDCTRKFTRDYDLSNHMEKVHKKQPVMATNDEEDYDQVVQGLLEFENVTQEEEEEQEEKNIEESATTTEQDDNNKYWQQELQLEQQNQQQQQETASTSSSPSPSSSSLLQPCMNKLEEYTNERGELYCKACNKHFKDLKTLQNHVYYHQRESKYHCDECGAKFKQRSDLRRHMSIHHDPNNKRECIPCPQCNRSFTHERYLRIHLNKECEGVPKDEQQQDVGQDEEENDGDFFESMNPQVEVEEVSTNESVSAMNQQQQQQQDIWDGEEPPNPLMFVSSDLQGDEEYGEEEDEGYDKGHHTTRQPVFECDLCEAFFSRSNELILHKRSAHAAALPSPQRNSSSPTSSSALKGKGKTFSCNKCGMSFLQKGELTQHLQQYHLDELPVHQCQFCPKYFYVKKSLDTHRRRHHSHLLNLIACQVCGMKFQAKEYLVSHMKSHHQIN